MHRVETSGRLGWSAIELWFTARRDGRPFDGSQYGTHVWRKADGRWRIVHEHMTGPVKLGVDDMEAMMAWYRDKLGYEVEKAWTVDGLPGIRLAYLIGHGGYRMELIAGGRGLRTPNPASFDEHFRMRGYQHACYWVDDVDAVMAELKGRGVEVFFPSTDFPAGAERRVALVKDPEGNVVEFAGPLSTKG